MIQLLLDWRLVFLHFEIIMFHYNSYLEERMDKRRECSVFSSPSLFGEGVKRVLALTIVSFCYLILLA